MSSTLSGEYANSARPGREPGRGDGRERSGHRVGGGHVTGKRAREEEIEYEAEAVTLEAPDMVNSHAYQSAMWEESMERNTLVAVSEGTQETSSQPKLMPVGAVQTNAASGKTQAAILRMKAELAKHQPQNPDQIIWFASPTSILCPRQHGVFCKQIPAMVIKQIPDGRQVEGWDVGDWTEQLKGIRIVMSTYQVLLDALTQGYVHMDRLSLLVLDEAHNCVGDHAGTKIMDRYRLNQRDGRPLPAILALTTGTMMNECPDPERLEANLDVVRSTRRHGRGPMGDPKLPHMSCVLYDVILETDDDINTQDMASLMALARGMSMDDDPWIQGLRGQGTEKSRLKLSRTLKNGKTYVFDQVRALCQRSVEVRCELGAWAADYLIRTAIDRYISSVQYSEHRPGPITDRESSYLANLLQRARVGEGRQSLISETGKLISPKFLALVKVLTEPWSEPVRGMVVVRRRGTVSILADVLTHHPLARRRFRVGRMVGHTQSSRRRNRGMDIIQEGTDDGDNDDLGRFRAGQLDVLVCTSDVEEGIDVLACNLIVCFDQPLDLKSFVQRRGRARMRASRLVLLLDLDAPANEQDRACIQKETKQRREAELRHLQELARLGDEEKADVPPLRSPLGNILDFDQAKAQLEHFCAGITPRQHADSRPLYVIKESDVPREGPGRPQLRATVVLPVSLPPELRRLEGSRWWYSETNACKDAAFQALTKLREAGFVNDHFQPVRDALCDVFGGKAAEYVVEECWCPWPQVAGGWKQAAYLNQRKMSLVDQHGKVLCDVNASLPGPFPMIPPFSVYWDLENKWTVQLGELQMMAIDSVQEDQSIALIDLSWGHRMPLKETPHVVHLRTDHELPFRQQVGCRPVERDEVVCQTRFLVRNPERHPHIVDAWLPARPDVDQIQDLPNLVANEPVEQPWLSLRKWPRRRDFLNPMFDDGQEPSSLPYKVVWPASLCRADSVGVGNVHFSALIPSILHIMEIYLVAERLCGTLLQPVDFSNLKLVVTALSSPQARESSNYERLEFLGDSILKLLTTVTLTANHPSAPEGFLSERKHRIVSNERLCQAAGESGLDRFILTKIFTGAKWQPLYVEDLLASPKEESKRRMSTKTLADVVESLIGAAYLDGGIDKALKAVSIFLPEIPWRGLDDARKSLFNRAVPNQQLPAVFVGLEELVGYRFRNKNLLIEAVTHSTFDRANKSADMCMERLEFVGDAILDDVVVSALWAADEELENVQMHLLRAASVNADLLGFHILDWTMSADADSSVGKPLWKYLRHSSPELGAAQRATELVFEQHRAEIREALRTGNVYPWWLLARLEIPKGFSDLFESLLGAIWIDSGCMDACRDMVERSGILPVLRRIIRLNIDVTHPKNMLGEVVGDKLVSYETCVKVVGEEHEWFCRVLVDGEFVVEVRKGINREEIQTKAAEAANRLFKSVMITEG